MQPEEIYMSMRPQPLRAVTQRHEHANQEIDSRGSHGAEAEIRAKVEQADRRDQDDSWEGRGLRMRYSEPTQRRVFRTTGVVAQGIPASFGVALSSTHYRVS